MARQARRYTTLNSLLMSINYNSFFKAYDIRATTPDLDARLYYWVGYALVEKILKPQNLPLEVNLIHDARETSLEFYSSLYQGIVAAGGKPVPLGLGTTELLYTACQMNNKAGCMVTASHNPAKDNGLKIVKQVPQMLGLESGLAIIRDFVVPKLENDNFCPEYKEIQTDDNQKTQLKNIYLEKLSKFGQIDEVNKTLSESVRKLKIVVDCANGVGSYYMNWIEALYGENIDFIKLYWEIDGTFPNHPADPLDFENLKDLQAKVLEGKADFGIALDGDADRAFFLDKDAQIIKGDAMVCILSTGILQDYFENPTLGTGNPVILFDQRSRRCTPEFILENGGAPYPTKVGHTNFKQNMLAFDCLYGGEVSGHHYYRDFGGMDCGGMTIVKFIQLMAQKPEVVENIIKRIKAKYFTSPGESNFKLPSDYTFAMVKEKIFSAYPEASFNLTDGITLFFEDWKANIRMSNTETLLRLNLETLDEDLVEEKTFEIMQILGI